jgi:ABC-type glycerol-3-phosphate transport system substrate-binding protein
MVGYYPATGADKELFMIPMYNYTMCLIYRDDLMNDSTLKSAYQKEFNKPFEVPENLEDFVALAQFMDDNTDLYGAAMQAGRGDPIVMEWSNYLFGLGGDYYDSNWNASIDNEKALKAIELYEEMIATAAPRGVLSYNLDDALRVMSQGEAFSMITYNWMLAQLNDEDKSSVVGKVALAPMPGEKSLAGGWGWGIAHNSEHKEEAWEFIKWVESFDVAKRRALAGGAPTRSDVLLDEDVLAAYPYYKTVDEILKKSQPVPEFQFSTQMVEVVGRELSQVVAEDKDAKKAMQEAADELDKLASDAGLK